MAHTCVTLQLEKDAELLRRLEALGKIGTQILANAVTEVAQPVLEMARRRAPRSPVDRIIPKTGKPRPHVRDSLHVVTRTWVRKTKAEARVTYSPASHGTFVERGARAHKVRTPWPAFIPGRLFTWQLPAMRARPFLAPAYASNWRAALVGVQARVWQAVEAAWNLRGTSAGKET
jgi:hypothetical protein